MTSMFRALALLLLCLAAPPALAGDVVLDQAVLTTGAKSKVIFKNVVLTDCNLSQTDAARLFTGALSREETGATLERMTAKKMTIKEADIFAENGGRFVLHDIDAENIVKGGADSLSLASVDGTEPDEDGDTSLHSNALKIQTISLQGLAAALRAGDIGLAAFHFAHLHWSGGQMSVVDKGTPAGAQGGNRVQIEAASAQIDQALDAGGAPLSVEARLTGLKVKLPPRSKGGAALAAFGYDKLSSDLHFAGAYDATAKTYKIADYSLDMNKIGKIAFSGQFSGLGKSAFAGDKKTREQAMEAANVDWAQIELTNSGLFEKLVAYFSLTQGQTPAAVKAEWRSVVSQAPMLFSGAPAIAVAAKAVDRFIDNPTTLTLRITGKDKKLKVGDLQHVADPVALLNRLDVSAPEPAKAAPAKTAPEKN